MSAQKAAATRRALAKSDPTMAALIERIGKIDLEERLRRRSEERPHDAYGALLRGIDKPSTASAVLGITAMACPPRCSITCRANASVPSPIDRTPTSAAAPMTTPSVDRRVRTGFPRKV